MSESQHRVVVEPFSLLVISLTWKQAVRVTIGRFKSGPTAQSMFSVLISCGWNVRRAPTSKTGLDLKKRSNKGAVVYFCTWWAVSPSPPCRQKSLPLQNWANTFSKYADLTEIMGLRMNDRWLNGVGWFSLTSLFIWTLMAAGCCHSYLKTTTLPCDPTTISGSASNPRSIFPSMASPKYLSSGSSLFPKIF